MNEKNKETECFPDNATWEQVLEYIVMCASSWDPEARIIGNARAFDVIRACTQALVENEYLRFQLLPEPTKGEQEDYQKRNERMKLRHREIMVKNLHNMLPVVDNILPVVVDGIELNAKAIRFNERNIAIKWEIRHPKTRKMLQFDDTQIVCIEDADGKIKRYLGNIKGD